MNFKNQCFEGIFLKRYNRFLADIKLNNEIITVHVPNTGSMKSCNTPNSPCLISKSDSLDRKLPYTLEAIKTNNTWVGVNTSWPNKLAVEAFNEKHIPHWNKFDRVQTEVKISKESRIDLVIWNQTIYDGKITPSFFEKTNLPFHLVEVKNVTLSENGVVYFPDAITERGQKHLHELMNLMKKGFTAEMLYIIQRDDCEIFKPATHIDPEYAQLLKQAHDEGLKITPLVVKISANGIKLDRILDFNIVF